MFHAKTRLRLYFELCISTPRALNQEPRCILGSLLLLNLAVHIFGARLHHLEEATEDWKPPNPPPRHPETTVAKELGRISTPNAAAVVRNARCDLIKVIETGNANPKYSRV